MKHHFKRETQRVRLCGGVVFFFFLQSRVFAGLFKVFTTLEARLESNLCPKDLKKRKATVTVLDHYSYYMSQTILDRSIRMKKRYYKKVGSLIIVKKAVKLLLFFSLKLKTLKRVIIYSRL